MALKKFRGAHTALVTPLKSDLTIDWAGFERNVLFQIEQGVNGFIVAGTTGESPTLDWLDHYRVIEAVGRINAGRKIIIAGAGSNSTTEALAASRHAADAGCDALLLVDCYYNCPSSIELRTEYHARIAAECPNTSVIPYVIPGRTGTAISPEDLVILAAEYQNVSCVKEASGDIERMAATRELAGKDFEIMSGDDNLTCQIMLDQRIQANGVISVTSNFAPAAVLKMVNAALSGDGETARAIDLALSPLFNAITITVKSDRRMPSGALRQVTDKFRNPLAVKAIMNGLGMPAGPTRPPLGRMNKLAIDTVRGAVREVWQNSPWVLEPIESFYRVKIDKRLADDSCWLPLAR